MATKGKGSDETATPKKTRRPWGQGGLQDLGDEKRWRLRYVVKEAGRPTKRKTATFTGNKAAADRRIRELQLEARASGAGSRGTLAPFIDRFIERTRDEQSEGTARIYSLAARKHVMPRWGGMKVSEIAQDDIRQWYASLMSGRGGTRAYSRNTVSGIHAVLRGALALAKDKKLIPENPLDKFKIRPPTSEKERRRARARRFMEPEQAAAYVAAAAHFRGSPILLFALMTGCRIGEATALRWSDVNLETGDVHFRRTRSNGGKGGSYESPGKTAQADRIVHTAGGPAHALLQAQAERLKTESALRLPGWVQTDYVFFTLRGGPYASTTIKNVQTKICQRAGLPYFTPHELRHTAATLLLNGGADLTATSKMLGHRHVSTTLDHYSHALPATAKSLSAILGGRLEGN